MKKAQYFIGILAMAFLLVQGVMDIANYFSSDSQPTMEMGQRPDMGQNGDSATSSANTSGDTSTSSDSSTTDADADTSSSDLQSQDSGQMTPPSGDFSGNGPQLESSGFNSIHQGTTGLVAGIVFVLLSGAGLVFTGMSAMNKRKEA